MTSQDAHSGAERPGGQPQELPFEAIPTYPILHFVGRNGKALALAVLIAGSLVGLWSAWSFGALWAIGLGLLLGGVLGFVVLVLGELTRALVDIMLPR